MKTLKLPTRKSYHQGRGDELIETPFEGPDIDGTVECRERLGGIRKYYRRAA